MIISAQAESENHSEAVFWEDVLTNKQALFGWAMKLTRDQIAAEDLLHNTMLKAVNKRNKFIVGTNLKSWLFTVMRNQFLTGLIRSSREVPLDPQEQDAIPDENVGTFLEDDELTHKLEFALHCMANLKDPMSTLLILKHYAGWTYEEIAKEINVSLGTVKSRVHRSMAKVSCQMTKKNITVCDIEVWLNQKIAAAHTKGQTILAKACEELLTTYLSQRKQLTRPRNTSYSKQRYRQFQTS